VVSSRLRTWRRSRIDRRHRIQDEAARKPRAELREAVLTPAVDLIVRPDRAGVLRAGGDRSIRVAPGHRLRRREDARDVVSELTVEAIAPAVRVAVRIERGGVHVARR